MVFTPRLTGTSPGITAELKKDRLITSHCARSGGFCKSSGHLAACLGATTARFGTTLAVIHIMLAALFRTPVADVRAQLANLFGKQTVAGDASVQERNICLSLLTMKLIVPFLNSFSVR